MRNIERLNPSKINNKGYYLDIDRGEMFPLSDEEIIAARNFFQMPELAKDRVIERKRPPQRKNYKVAQHQKYNDGRHRKRGRTNLAGHLKMLIIGASICVVTVYGTFMIVDTKGNAAEIEDYSYYQMEEANAIPITYETLSTSVEEKLSENDLSTIQVQQLINDENIERREWVQKYCDIYQVNFDTVYSKLVELTNNFQSSNYLNGYIPGVTCKGQEVYANSEEELILYFVRCAKQLPSQLGLSSSQLNTQTEYQSSYDYASTIGYYSNLLGVDPVLSYAITQAETSFNSDLFVNSNNPAGLKMGNNWWVFSTKEEGFIELALEILKYNRKGAYTIEEIGSIHAPVEDGNANWIPNVTAVYNEILNNSDLYSKLQGNDESNYTR